MSSNIFLAIVGVLGGATVAAGVFALITTINIIPRFAHVTKTKDFILSYETSILCGGIFGSLMTTTPLAFTLPEWTVILFGLFSGIFVGALAITLAETLDVSTIFARRLRLHTGISWIILCLALGKILGSLIYFIGHYEKIIH
jgi:stage V sporulation protein AB